MTREIKFVKYPNSSEFSFWWVVRGETCSATLHILGHDYRVGLKENYEVFHTVNLLPANVGYHCNKKSHEYEHHKDKCEFAPGGGPCYYDGSGLAATELWNEVRATGDADRIWTRLEEIVREHEAEAGEKKETV